jgi:phenylacetic acid degradation operon negative regulatory protein
VKAPTAKSFVLDLLSTLGAGAMPVRSLIAAAALFAIGENNLRVGLARLLAAGLVERDERGQYRLAGDASAVREQVASWRRIEERMRPWDGGWIAAHVVARGTGGERARLRRRKRALRMLGFRDLAPGLALRPDNLAGGVLVVRERLVRLGLEPETIVASLTELDATTEARARRLWDAERLVTGYARTRAALERSERRLARLAPTDAMTESFLLGGRAIREIVLDPLLPEPLVPSAARSALVEAMRRYDRAGRAAWSAFLRDAGVPGLRMPAPGRVMGTPGHLAATGGIA